MRERVRSPAAACAGQASPGRAPWRRRGRREGGKGVCPAAGATREGRGRVVVLFHLSFQLFLSVTFWTAPISGGSPPPGSLASRSGRRGWPNAMPVRSGSGKPRGRARSGPRPPPVHLIYTLQQEQQQGAAGEPPPASGEAPGGYGEALRADPCRRRTSPRPTMALAL